MAYIGKEPIVGNFQVCDAISVVNGQAAYTMQVGSVNVSPETANHMLVSLNGILQKPGSSFTVSGSTITFASALATGDVIDFIMLLGNVLDLGVPSDATVTNAKTNFVSTSSAAGLQIKGDGTTDGTLQLNCSQNSHGVKIASPAHSAGQSYTLTLPTGNVTADKFLKVASVSGSGTTGIGQLSFADAGGGAWNLLQTATASSSSTVDITTGMDSTYQNYAVIYSNVHPATDDVLLSIRVSTDGGSSFDSSSNYRYSSHCLRDNGSEGLTVSTGNDKLLVSGITFGNANNESGNGIVYIGNPSSSTFSTSFNILASNIDNSGRSSTCNTGGFWSTTTAVNGIQFFFTSGNVDAGVFKLYGIS